jgi:hypothetical protein
MPNLSWRNWIDDEWLAVTSLWEDDVADYLGAAIAAGVSFLILRIWQLIRNWRTGAWGH